MGRHRGSGKGEELQHQQRQEQQTDGDDAGQMVVGTGVTMDYSVIEDRTLNVIVRGVMRHAVLKTETVVVTGRFHGAVEACSLEVMKGALFLGKAMVHSATVAGRLEGILVVGDMLNMRSSGHCDGVLRYGQLNVQHGGKLTGAVKAASDADVGIGEIPVPDLPEGTWDNFWTTSPKEQSSSRLTVGGRKAGRLKGRILRSAGQTSKQENSLARTAAENYARAAASEASAAAASGSIVGEESEDQLETSTNSRANSLTPGGGEQERREGFAAPHYSGRDAEAGGAVGEQLGIPGKRSGEAFFRSAPARTEAGISDVDVGEKGDDRLGGDRDGGHGGGRGWGLRDPPAVDGSPASESEVDMLDFLQEAGQRRLREEAEEEHPTEATTAMRTPMSDVGSTASDLCRSEEDSSDAGETSLQRILSQRGVVSKGDLRKKAVNGRGDLLSTSMTVTSQPESDGASDIVGADSDNGSPRPRSLLSSSSAAAAMATALVLAGVTPTSSSIADAGEAGERREKEEEFARGGSVFSPDASSLESTTPLPLTLSVAAMASRDAGGADVVEEKTPRLLLSSTRRVATSASGRGDRFKHSKHPRSTPEDRKREIEAAKAALRSRVALRKASQGRPLTLGPANAGPESAPKGFLRGDPASDGARAGGGGGAFVPPTSAPIQRLSSFSASQPLTYSKETMSAVYPRRAAERTGVGVGRGGASTVAGRKPGEGVFGPGDDFFLAPSPAGASPATDSAGGVSSTGVSPATDVTSVEGAGAGRGGSRTVPGGVTPSGHRHARSFSDDPDAVPAATVAAIAAMATYGDDAAESNAVEGAAAAAALLAGDKSFSAATMVLTPDATPAAVASRPQRVRGVRISGSYTQAAVAAVAAATATAPATTTEEKGGRSEGDEEVIRAVVGAADDGEREEHEIAGIGKPPTPRHQLRVAPGDLDDAALSTPIHIPFDRSKLQKSPARQFKRDSRHSKNVGSGDAYGGSWVHVKMAPVSPATVAANAAANAANSAKQSESRMRAYHRPANFDWRNVGNFPLVRTEQLPLSEPMSPLVITHSTSMNGSDGTVGVSSTTPYTDDGVHNAPVSPIVAMPSAEHSARELGGVFGAKSKEEMEAEEVWSAGMEALMRRSDSDRSRISSPGVPLLSGAATSTSSGRWDDNGEEDDGDDNADDDYEDADDHGKNDEAVHRRRAGVGPAESSPESTLVQTDTESPPKAVAAESPSTATAAALGAALSTAMARGRTGSSGSGQSGSGGDSRSSRYGGRSVDRQKMSTSPPGGRHLDDAAAAESASRFQEHADAKNSSSSSSVSSSGTGTSTSASTASGGNNTGWRDLRDSARAARGGVSLMRPASAVIATRIPSAVEFKRSALPTLGELRRASNPVSPVKPSPTAAALEAAGPTHNGSVVPKLDMRMNGDSNEGNSSGHSDDHRSPSSRRILQQRRKNREATPAAGARQVAAEAVAARDAAADRAKAAAVDAEMAATKAEDLARAAAAAAQENATRSDSVDVDAERASDEEYSELAGVLETADRSDYQQQMDAVVSRTPGEHRESTYLKEDTGTREGRTSSAAFAPDLPTFDVIAVEEFTPFVRGKRMESGENGADAETSVSPISTAADDRGTPATAMIVEARKEGPTPSKKATELAVLGMSPSQEAIDSRLSPTSLARDSAAYFAEHDVDIVAAATPPPAIVLSSSSSQESAEEEASEEDEAFHWQEKGHDIDRNQEDEDEMLIESESENPAAVLSVQKTSVPAALAGKGEAVVDEPAEEESDNEKATPLTAPLAPTAAFTAAPVTVPVLDVEKEAAAALDIKPAAGRGDEELVVASPIQPVAPSAGDKEEAATSAPVLAVTATSLSSSTTAEEREGHEDEAEEDAASLTVEAAAQRAAEADARADALESSVLHRAATMPSPKLARGAAAPEHFATPATGHDSVEDGVANDVFRPTPTESSANNSPSSSPGPASFSREFVGGKAVSPLLGPRKFDGSSSGKKEGRGSATLTRIGSETVLGGIAGGMRTNSARGLVAGKPSRERSGFVAAETVKKGLGPAGAFTGNANWRLEAGRNKSSAADVQGDGHGGFHNPMAALRAQQQQQQQQQQVGRVRRGSEEWNGRAVSKSLSPSTVTVDKPISSGILSAAPSRLTLAPDSSEEKASDSGSGGALPMPAWMLSKGMAGAGVGSRALRSPSGLARPRGSHGGGGRPGQWPSPPSIGGSRGTGVGGAGGRRNLSPLLASASKDRSTGAAAVTPAVSTAESDAGDVLGLAGDTPTEASSTERTDADPNAGESQPDKGKGTTTNDREVASGTTSEVAAAASQDSVKPAAVENEEDAQIASLGGSFSDEDENAVAIETVTAPAVDGSALADVGGLDRSDSHSLVQAGPDEQVEVEAPVSMYSEAEEASEDDKDSPSQSGVASGSPGGFAALGRFLFGNRTETGSEDQRKDQEEGQDEVDAGDATEAQSPPQSPKQSEDPVGESSDHGTATEISDALAKGDSSQADNGDATEDAEPATAPSSSADDNPAAVPMASSPEEVTGDETAVEVDETSAGFDAVSMGSEEEDTKAMAIAQPMSPKVDSSTFVVGPPISPRAVDEIGGEPSTSAVPAEADLAPTVDVAVEEDGVTADESHLDSGEDREEGAEVAVAATEGAGSGQEAGLARVLVSSGEEAEKEAGNQEDLDREEDEPLKDDDNGADVSAAGARPVSDRSLAARIGAAGVGRPRSLLSPRGKAGGNIKARPLSGKAVSLLSGERKTGLAALEQQGTPARAARRALLEESKRRTSESKPRHSIFETLRMRSSGNFAASSSEKNHKRQYSGRRSFGDTRGSREARSLTPEKEPDNASKSAPNVDADIAAADISPREEPQAEETFRVSTTASANDEAREKGQESSAGMDCVDLGDIDYEQVENDESDSDEDSEPDYWSKYGVIDAAALDEDAEIEI